MPRSHLHDLWTNTCGLTVTGSRCATCFWNGRSCMCNEVWKEGKAYALRWKSSRMWTCFWTAQNARIWSFLKMTTRFICFARCYLILDAGFTALWLHFSLPFSCQAPSSFFLAPITIFAILTSWHWDYAKTGRKSKPHPTANREPHCKISSLAQGAWQKFKLKSSNEPNVFPGLISMNNQRTTYLWKCWLRQLPNV